MYLNTFFHNPIDDNNQYTGKLDIVNFLSCHIEVEFQVEVKVNIQKRTDNTDDPYEDHIFSRTYPGSPPFSIANTWMFYLLAT